MAVVKLRFFETQLDHVPDGLGPFQLDRRLSLGAAGRHCPKTAIVPPKIRENTELNAKTIT